MKRWILFLIVSVFLIGCAKTKIVDDIDLVQVAAYDTEAKGKLKGTFAISAYKGGGEGETKIYSASGQTGRSSCKSIRKIFWTSRVGAIACYYI